MFVDRCHQTKKSIFSSFLGNLRKKILLLLNTNENKNKKIHISGLGLFNEMMLKKYSTNMNKPRYLGITVCKNSG